MQLSKGIKYFYESNYLPVSQEINFVYLTCAMQISSNISANNKKASISSLIFLLKLIPTHIKICFDLLLSNSILTIFDISEVPFFGPFLFLPVADLEWETW